MWRPLVALAALALPAAAAPPCKRCTLDAPAKLDQPAPLVVVLHGDRQSASDAVARWRGAVSKRGWVVLGLQCPADLGCKDSFWKWDGDPSWVIDQVDKVEHALKIDPAHVYLVGWSGGATYIGRHAQAWESVFAALVIHGGGHEPYDDACVKELPAYFLVGDKNPLHELMKDLRAYFDRCHQDVTWDLVRGGDHDKEERALDGKKAAAILDWLAERHRER